ncbi:MAG: 50S ribosomal protein L3 N(5)-glutamine methyltransferase [Burkholderiales bacterium]|nr:50S ribosomal protein L3 N(5)-glutamine methyltransferase [Burkholderiales bacterium]
MSAANALPYRTVRDLMRHGVSRLTQAGAVFGHGVASAYDETAWLVLHCLHLPPDCLDVFLDARLTDAEIATCVALLERRATERVPAAYLTGTAWLGERRYHVDERVIVPRSFIAELLRDGFAPWVNDPAGVRRVLDLCTGSGCLAIEAAHAFPDAAIDAVDLSNAALEVARRNVDAYALEERVTLVRGDLLGPLAGRRYDVILSNPPYVDTAAMAALPPEYRAEPALALAAGDDGLDIVRRILADAARHLEPHGVLVVEVGHQRARVEAAWPRLPFKWLPTASGPDYVFLLEAAELR